MRVGKMSGKDRNQDYEGTEEFGSDKRELENVVDGVGKRRKEGALVGERK